ncbi:MAG TPA: ABC transporter permease [Pyrinomonadaceae bacterium]|nr:ABC transporter permease [Pyrinomonadaceae bacterium]
MDTLIKDIRHGVRSLLRRPGFTAIAVLTLALGIGACTAIFSVVDGVLLRPLPYPNAERLVQLREVTEKGARIAFAGPNFQDLKERSQTLDAVAQYAGGLTTVTGGSEPTRARAFAVSLDFFRVLGTQPAIGRTFTSEDSRVGAAPTVVVSQGFWQRMFGGRQELSSATVQLRDVSYTVIGVMPARVSFPQDAELWLPSELSPSGATRTGHNWAVIASVRPGVTFEQVRAELSGIANQLKQEHGKATDAVDFAVIPQQEYLVGDVRQGLLIILAAVGLLLTIACANVANLLLAQVTARQREFAVRSALGATRFRLARQFVTENMLLALAAAALGVLLSYWGVDLLLGLNEESLPRIKEIGVDGRAIAFTVGLAMLVAVVLGLVPLFRFSGQNLETTLRETGRGLPGHSGKRLRSLLIVGQMALTVMLLVGAGLLAKSFYRLLMIDPGFQTESAVAMEISLRGQSGNAERFSQFMDSFKRLKEQGIAPTATTKFTDEENRQTIFHEQLLERLRSLPGVVAVGSINRLPLTGSASSGRFFINNNPAREGSAEYRLATSDYFAAMGIPVLRGRTFDQTDKREAPNAAVISQSLARKYWPNEEPIGQTIQFGNMDGDLRLLHIVGVVGDVHDRGVDTAPSSTVYGNTLQRLPPSSLSIVVRAQVAPDALVPAMREAVRSLDPQVPVNFLTLDQVFSSSLDQRRFSLVIFGVFGGVALLLAALGIYGVTTYSVTQRTQEIGIRMALGAQAGDVLKLVLRNAIVLSLIGLGIGLASAWGLTRLMESLLFGVTPTDVTTFASVSTLLMLVVLAACYLPARRATSVDPLVALRNE